MSMHREQWAALGNGTVDFVKAHPMPFMIGALVLAAFVAGAYLF